MLTYNPKIGAYALTSDDVARAESAGLTLSTKARSRLGERMWFTSSPQNHSRPLDNPYAVLEYWDEADDLARARLAPFKRDYDASWATDSDVSIPLSRHAREQGWDYFDYQRAGIEYCAKRGHCLIGDAPGLGKTVQAIGLANLDGAERILVICPGNVRSQWRKFARDWSVIPNVSTYPVMKSRDGVHPFSNYVIISYDLARNEAMQELLAQTPWDMVVLDEAHYLKTVDARRTQAVFGTGRYKKGGGVIGRAKRVLALTGTPLMNRPRECYTLARGLNWESIDFLSEDAFRWQFNPSARMYGDAVEERLGRLPELRARLRCNFMVRRLKEDVLKDLPDKRYELTYVEPDGAIKAALARERLLDFDPSMLLSPDFVLDGMISTVRREMGEAKVPRIVEHMKYLLDLVEIPKVVLFSHHRSVLGALNDALTAYNPVYVRGGMGDKAKTAAVEAFVEDPAVRIFQGQTESVIGIDGLQKVASHVVFAEPSWTPGGNEQAADRCHRVGQHDNVIVQFLIAEGSFDEMVLNAVLDKVHTINEALDGL